MENTNSTIYRILRLLRANVLKILIQLRESKTLKWKEIQERTKLPTATLNRSLSALQEIHFISKEDEGWALTWAGKLAIDGLFLLGLKMSKYPKNETMEDIIAEHVLAQNIVLAVLVIIFASIKIRGKIDLGELEKGIEEEKEVIYQIVKEYEKEGYFVVSGKKITSTEKFKEMNLDHIFPI